ncbi:tumor necrosis factor ligand superfamily member 6-like [Haliotis asinina]|uniref:tumor necrosis factor ligand superfamily member 6-like n=1 Tax=Haliotis asinina TaxID=109174 RepID=UPI003531D855
MADAEQSFLPRKPKYDSSQFWRRCLYTSVATSLTCSLALLVVFVMKVGFSFRGVDHPRPDNNIDSGAVCLVCDHIGSSVQSSETLYDLVRTPTHALCCLNNGSISSVFQQMIADQQPWTEANAYSGPSSPSSLMKLRENVTGAHLYLDTNSLSKGRLSWVDQDKYGTAYISRIGYHNHRLVIPSAGRYFLYSHITFTRKFPETRGGKDFIHRLTRYHPKQPKLGEVNILVSKDSYPQFTTQKSSFQSAILNFRSHDQLAVRVSDTDSVHSNSMYSYFGVIKL